jgi:hypothetical protein
VRGGAMDWGGRVLFTLFRIQAAKSHLCVIHTSVSGVTPAVALKLSELVGYADADDLVVSVNQGTSMDTIALDAHNFPSLSPLRRLMRTS